MESEHWGVLKCQGRLHEKVISLALIAKLIPALTQLADCPSRFALKEVVLGQSQEHGATQVRLQSTPVALTCNGARDTY